MTETTSSLMDELYSDSGPFDEKRVVSVLKTVTTVAREGHLLCPVPGISLKASDKILAYGLVKRLLKADGSVEQSSMSGKEIAEKTGLKKGTVDPLIKELKEGGLLTGKGKSYEISVHHANTILERLEKYKPVTKK